ncbi:MAG: hypothetical protein ACYTGF_15880, partial [Planctomycetota bacterium]
MIARRFQFAAFALLLLVVNAVHGAQQAAEPSPAPKEDGPTIESVQERIDKLQKLETDGTIDEEGKTRLGLYR